VTTLAELELDQRRLCASSPAFLFDHTSAKEPFRFVAEFSNGALVRRGKRRPKWAASLLKTFSKEER